MKSVGDVLKRMPAWILICSIIVGTMLIFLETKRYQRDRQSFNWPMTQGVMYVSEWTYRTSGGRWNSGSYKGKVAFVYKVNGQNYRSESIALWPCNDDEAGKLIQTHPVGTTVDVLYNPNDPKQAVLIPGASVFGVYGVTGFACLCYGLLFSCARLGRKASPSMN